MTNKPIILIGPMGCGKTSIGHRLSCALKYDFFDTDNELVERTGVSISYIFDIEGEAGFRLRESKILTKLCQLNNIVLATGGGIILNEDNREMIKNKGVVIYLKSSVKFLLKQTAKSKHRPLLENSFNREKTITDILNAREHWYQECSDKVINVPNKNFYMIINEIKTYLNTL